jgi:uncharacterized protein
VLGVRGLFVHWVRAALLVVTLAGWAGVSIAQDLQPVPALTGHVIDSSGTLSESQRQALDARLAAFERDKGSQVVVLMVATTQPEDIASYANRIGNAWKIGRKEAGDGLLLVVAKNDRKVRIEVAKSLEGAIPDLAAKQIIDDAITPRFRQGDFAGGLDAAAERIMALISHEALPAPSESPASGRDGESLLDIAGAALFAMFFAGFFLGPIARAILGRKLGAAVTGVGLGTIVGYMEAPVLLAAIAGFVAFAVVLITGRDSAPRGGGTRRDRGKKQGRGRDWASGAGGFGGGFGSGSSGGWSSGGSSDSFSSGGGGDFGGGGASGDW